MKARSLKIAALALFAVPLYLYSSSCAPECVDFADCSEKAREAGQQFTCEAGVCKAGSPFPDAGSGGGGGGDMGGGGGDMGGGAGGGGETGGGGGATGGGGGDTDAGMDDAGTDDAGMDLDAGMDDAGMDTDAGTDDAGMEMDAGALFDLTFSGTGYEPHAMHVIRVHVVQTSDGGIVGNSSVTPDGGGLLEFSFPGILREGEAYNFDYYADVNGNSMCGGNDHVWRIPVPAVSANVNLTRAHDMNFTAAACDSF